MISSNTSSILFCNVQFGKFFWFWVMLVAVILLGVFPVMTEAVANYGTDEVSL